MGVSVPGDFCRYIDEDGNFKFKTYHKCIDYESELTVVYGRDYSYSLIDSKGKEIRKLPSGYEYIGVKNRKIKIQKNGLYGMMDLEGRIFVKPGYPFLGFESEGRIAYCKKLYVECGYLDSNGAKKIEAAFVEVGDYKRGYAKVRTKDNKLTAIDLEGKLLLSKEYEIPCGIGEGPFPVISKPEGQIRYYNMDGTWRDLPQGVRLISPFSEGLSFFFKDRSFGVLDETFNIVWEKQSPDLDKFFIYEHSPVTDQDRQYSICYFPYQYKSGFVLVSSKVSSSGFEYLDRNGNSLETIRFSDASNFRGNLAKVEYTKDKLVYHGILNRSGKIIYSYLKRNPY